MSVSLPLRRKVLRGGVSEAAATSNNDDARSIDLAIACCLARSHIINIHLICVVSNLNLNLNNNNDNNDNVSFTTSNGLEWEYRSWEQVSRTSFLSLARACDRYLASS